MYRNVLAPKQLATWLCTALIPVVLQMCIRPHWALLLAVAVCFLATALVWKWGRVSRHPILCGLQYLYIIVLLSQLLPHAAASWPGDNYPAVPLVLLILAAWSAQKGASAAARVGCVLFWLVLLFYLSLMGAAAEQVDPGNWAFSIGSIEPLPLVLLLLPCGALVLRKIENGTPRLWLIGVFLLLSCLITQGAAPELLKRTADPLYELSRGIRAFGIAQRFEALLSAAMTTGWFCLLTVLLSCAGAWGSRNRGVIAVWVAAGGAGVLMLCNLHISWNLAAIMAAVFWVGIPLLTQGLDRRKNL